MHLNKKELALARFIIGSIDDNGYLGSSMPEIAVATGSTMEQVESILKTIQSFDPPGVAARNLRECLELQAQSRGLRDLPLRIIRHYLDDLGQARYSRIAQEEQVPLRTYCAPETLSCVWIPNPGPCFPRGT